MAIGCMAMILVSMMFTHVMAGNKKDDIVITKHGVIMRDKKKGDIIISNKKMKKCCEKKYIPM